VASPPGSLREERRACTALASVEATDLDLWQYSAASGAYTIVDVLDKLPWFRAAPDWTAWRAFLCAAYGLPMTPAEFAIYRHCTGRTVPPTVQAREVWMACGRRARKSAIAALMAVWAGGKDYTAHVAPGERPWIPILAKNRDDAQQIKRFADSILAEMPWLLLESKSEEIHLATGVDLVIRAARITAGRSRACPFAALDEVAFFPTDEAASPDSEILRGIRPGMATIPGAMVVGLSSPYARRGALYEAHRDHFGRDGDPILVWQAPTLEMHDTPQIRAEVEAEYLKDPESAAAEYGAAFRTDVTAFVTDEVVLACTSIGVTERPPERQTYFAFVDPAGGTQDSMAWAVAHHDPASHRAVLDLLREVRPPFDPSIVMGDMAADLKRYRVGRVTGDRYGGMWNRAPLQPLGITYIESERAKSDIYRDALPLLTSKRADLLDIPRLRLQLTGLDRRTARGGRDSIDHRPGSHDDAVNCALGALLLADERGRHRGLPAEVEPEPTTTAEIWIRKRRDAFIKAEATKPPIGGPGGRRLVYRGRGLR
jgi:hypothetical protein